MVNENKGKVYKPVPVYNRRLVREVIRNQCAAKWGHHKVSKQMSAQFELLRKDKVK
jgi:hypothetical protein